MCTALISMSYFEIRNAKLKLQKLGTNLYHFPEMRNQSTSLTHAKQALCIGHTFLTIATLGEKPSLGCYFIFMFHYYIFLLSSI